MISTAPIFLCGTSRSGTSVVQAAIGKVDGWCLTGETHYFDDLRVRLASTLGRALSETEYGEAERYFQALTHRPYGHGGDPARGWLEAGQLKEEVGDGLLELDQLFLAYNRLYARRQGARFWGEKTPRHVFRIADIFEVCPDARVIFMLRDPRAVAASYRDWKSQGGLKMDDGYSDALEVERSRARASYHPVTATLLWKAAWTAASGAAQRFGPDRVRIQRYESTVLDPETELANLMDWLGLEQPPGMTDVPVRNSSFDAYQERGGFQRSAIDRWRTLLTPAEVRVVEQAAGAALEAAGYERQARGGHFGAALSWLSFLPAAGRAVRRNAGRSGSLPGYVWRRARLAMGRS